MRVVSAGSVRTTATRPSIEYSGLRTMARMRDATSGSGGIERSVRMIWTSLLIRGSASVPRTTRRRSVSRQNAARYCSRGRRHRPRTGFDRSDALQLHTVELRLQARHHVAVDLADARLGQL